MKAIRKLSQIASATALGVALAGGAASAAETVTIGFTGPLSGGAALYGQNTLSGLQMAAEEINGNGGFKVGGNTYTINIEALDDRYSPSQAGVNGKRLVQESGAKVIFTPHSGGTFALQAFNEKDGFLVMSYTSVPTVTKKGNTLTARIPPTFDGYMQPFTKLAMEMHGKKVGIVNATHDYAKAWTKLFVPAWEAAGGTVVADNPMDYNKSADFYTGVSKVLAAKPDVLFVGGASEPTGLVVRQARELGFKGGFIIMDQAKMDEMAQVTGGIPALEGSVGVVPLALYPTDEAQSFVKRYEAKYDKTPGSEAAYNYLALHAVVEAMKISGKVDDAKAIRGALGDALKALPLEKNPYAVTEIEPDGGFHTDTSMAIVKNGKVERVVMSEVLAK